MSKQSQKDRLDELQQYTVPAAKYFWISGPEIAIHKGFLKYYTLSTFLSGIILTLVSIYTPFWQRVYAATPGLLNWIFIQNWYISLPAAGIGIVYLNYRHSHRKKQRREERRIDERRRRLDKLINEA